MVFDPQAWLAELRQTTGFSRAALTLGRASDPWRRWCGDRWLLWPQGCDAQSTVGFASSRLGRKLEQRESWFFVLRAVCAKLERDRERLVCVSDTAAAPFVERAAHLFGGALLRVHLPPERIAWNDWLRWLIDEAALMDGEDKHQDVFVSPPPSATDSSVLTEMPSLPLRDRVLIALSDRLVVSHVRPQGNLHCLLRRRLEDAAWPTTTTHIALGTELTSRRVADELLDRGAVGWRLIRSVEEKESMEASVSSQPAETAATPASILSVADPISFPYLIHCTRRKSGPWPDQPMKEFVEQLLLDDAAADHSALAALRHIVISKKLFASTAAIRGGHAMVSFAELPLAEIAKRRTFRSHRVRWDFEPYGIGIDRRWLEQRGTRPAIYGDEETWKSLDETSRPFFQLAQSQRGETPIDWTAEREWRHPGEVDLRELPSNAAFVFVPTRDDAEQLAAISPWPVIVLGE